MFSPAFLLSLSLLSTTVVADHIYSATYLPSNVPAQTEDGQSGTNQCGTALNQSSLCQTVYMNSLTDWCFWAPPEPGPNSNIGDTEQIEVAWCTKNGTGARLIPDGAIQGAHWLITPDYIQVTGIGDMTLVNVPLHDTGGGGELDPHGADGNGNPVGGIVFSDAFGGTVQEIFEWTNFMGPGEFCFRICNPKGSNPAGYCQHIYDEMGCDWNMPGNYGPGFDTCHADSGEAPGVYGGSTFHQGDGATPAPHPAPNPTACTTVSTISNGFIINGTNIALPTATSSASGSAITSPASASGSHSGSGSGASQTNSPSSAVASIQSWERTVVSVGAAVVFSLVGAAVVL
ncbi:hypothetical protein MSAN_01402400 [Mycena sanguinolenta]|uniref:Macrofage activating glycoprotein n=1 Tax=Mycena sanguinolenta TaxID=230812 RepID=A0A8H7CY53_9AGAR|nr:hypothetical protein MSAN_01402400 [Mycena sanguinolenta]